MNKLRKGIWKIWYGFQGTWDEVEHRLAKLTCRYLGHAKPAVKLHCEICSRCNKVTKYTDTQLRFNVTRPTIRTTMEKPDDKN